MSVDTSKEGTIEFGQGNQVTVTAPNTDGSGHSESVFTGSRKPHLKECVLIIDHETGEITIERLSQQITVKQTRMESKGSAGSSIQRPSTPVSDSGSIVGNRKHSPNSSGQNHLHTSNHRSGSGGGGGGGKSPRTSVSPSTPNSSLSSHSSQNNNRVAKCSPNLSSPAILTSHSDDVSILSESSSDDDDDAGSSAYHVAGNGVSESKSPIPGTRFSKSSDVMSSSSSSSSSDEDDDEDRNAGQEDLFKLNGFKALNGTLPHTPSDVKMMSSDAESSADNDDQQEESEEEEGEIRQRNGTLNGKAGITSSSSKSNDASAQNNSATLLSMPHFSQLSQFPLIHVS